MADSSEETESTENNFWEMSYTNAKSYQSNALNEFEDCLRSYPKESLVGEGGVKKVYKSYDWKTERHIALAVPISQTDKKKSIEFIQEARILGQLEHPNIIPIYDTGLDEDESPYFTMKYIEGKDLASVIKSEHENGSFESRIPYFLDIFKKVCLALSYAHSKGVVHLDIKPDNVLIGSFGEVFLCDWGIAEKSNEIECVLKLL